MEQQFEAVLTGPDTPVDGIVTKTKFEGAVAYDFKSLDETVHMIISKNEDGNWIRAAGTDPYLSGWVDELAQQII